MMAPSSSPKPRTLPSRCHPAAFVTDHYHLSSLGGAPLPATIDLTVTDISCAKCKDNIEGDLASDPGVHSATVDVDARTVHIAYDERQTSPGWLRTRLGEIGYPADP
jgi:copper chaperone CopZ